MNVAKYVRIDYLGFVHLVDALGGIDVKLREEERDHINKILTNVQPSLEKNGYLVQFLEDYGDNTRLNGLQALAYAKTRKLDSDFSRTGRQRQIINAIVTRVKRKGLSLQTIRALWQVWQQDVQTNMNWAELASVGMKVLSFGGFETHRLPAEGCYTDTGSVLTIDAEANANMLYEWLYGLKREE